jgi:cobalt-zinc-cadmium efflux system outer membrane protein
MTAALAAVLCLSQAMPARAPAAPAETAQALSRGQAVEQALAHNPQLEAARQQVAEARAGAVQATAIPDPSLTTTFDELRQPFGVGAGTREVNLGLTVPLPQKQVLRARVARGDVRTAELAYTTLRQQVAAQAVQGYDALLVALRHARDLEEAHQVALDFVRRTEARYQGGTVARLDVVKATVDASQVQNDLIAAQRDIANARAALNRLMGRALGADVEPADTLAPPAPIAGLEALRARAAASRPELQALAAQRTASRAATQLARQFWLPDLSLGFSRTADPGNPSSYTTSVGFALPLFFWQHRGGEVALAQHRERELAAQALDLSAQVEQEVRTAWANASTALQQVAFIRDQLLPVTEQAYRIASSSYALGGSSALEVLDARRALLDAQQQYAEALGAANDAVAELELAAGGSLPDAPAANPLSTPAPGGAR